MIILSIKPKYAEMILNGKKRWEFRKRRLPQDETILMYATAPIKKIVGSFTVIGVISADVEDRLDIFRKIQYEAGITDAEFIEYFNNSDRCYMMRIAPNNMRIDIDPKTIDKNFIAPQSWKRSEIEWIENL